MATFGLAELRAWLHQFALELDDRQLEQARSYLETLLQWNRKTNLVSQQRADEIIAKHFADGFVAASLIDAHASIADLGSGGGFPAIPIAIARPESSLRLIESNQKKASFLAEVSGRCDLKHVRVICDRIDAVVDRQEMCGSHTVVTARALDKLHGLTAPAKRLLALGGCLLAMKGPGYGDELKELEPSSYRLEKTLQYSLPDKSPRTILLLSFT